MYPHLPNKLIATKYCFLIVRDDTSFVFSINCFSFLCSVELHCFIYFAVINFYKNYFIIIIIIILFINNVSIKIIVIFYVPEWSVFGFYDRRLIQIRCKNVINAPGWQFTPFLNATTNLNLKMNPKDGSIFFIESDFWESVKNNTCRLSSRESVR